MAREETKDILGDILGGGNNRKKEDKKEPSKPTSSKSVKKRKAGQSSEKKNEYIRIHISIKKRELQELDKLVDYLFENGEIPSKNRSFVARLVLKKYAEDVFS